MVPLLAQRAHRIYGNVNERAVLTWKRVRLGAAWGGRVRMWRTVGIHRSVSLVMVGEDED